MMTKGFGKAVLEGRAAWRTKIEFTVEFQLSRMMKKRWTLR